MWETDMVKGKHLHVRCITHILKLIVQDDLEEIGLSIKWVRQMKKYIRTSFTKDKETSGNAKDRM